PEEHRVWQTVPFRTRLRHRWPPSLRSHGVPPLPPPRSAAHPPSVPGPSYRIPRPLETPRDAPRQCAASPRYRRRIYRGRQPLQVGHELPDRIGRQHAPERRHAARPAVIDRLEDRAVGTPIAPAPVGKARPLPPGSTQGMTAVTVERAEQLLSVHGR